VSLIQALGHGQPAVIGEHQAGWPRIAEAIGMFMKIELLLNAGGVEEL
jgi:hypothetical protein